MSEAKIYYDEMLKLREQNDRLREALQSIIDDWEYTRGNPEYGDRGNVYAEAARQAIQEA